MATFLPPDPLATGLPPYLVELLVPRIVERDIEDSLAPALKMVRIEDSVKNQKLIEAREHQSQRVGLLPRIIAASKSSDDPAARKNSLEFYALTPKLFNDSQRIDLLANAADRKSMVMKLRSGVSQAIRTREGLSRNMVYEAASLGETYNTVAIVAPTTTVTVKSLNGLTHRQVNGVMTAVSVSNPLPVIVGTAGQKVETFITGYTPTDANDLTKGGTITVVASITALDILSPVLADHRSYIVRVGGGATDNAITTSNKLTLATVMSARTKMKTWSVPGFNYSETGKFPANESGDGFYVCYLDAKSMSDLFADAASFGNLIKYDASFAAAYSGYLGYYMGVVFIDYEMCPQASSIMTGELPGVPTATEGTGVAIHRPILIGSGAVRRDYMDIEQAIRGGAEGAAGLSIPGSGAIITLLEDSIRMVIKRAPAKTDRFIDVTWEILEGRCAPTDALAGDTAGWSKTLQKRMVMMVHG